MLRTIVERCATKRSPARALHDDRSGGRHRRGEPGGAGLQIDADQVLAVVEPA
jgi:hypothetical protein